MITDVGKTCECFIRWMYMCESDDFYQAFAHNGDASLGQHFKDKYDGYCKDKKNSQRDAMLKTLFEMSLENARIFGEYVVGKHWKE